MPKTNFKPEVHGFHFSNSFKNQIWSGPPKIETYGRCGGMAFASLDCYFAGVTIPSMNGADFPGAGVPPDGHPVADYIYARLFDSFSLNGLTHMAWTQALDHQTLLRGPGVIRSTKLFEIPKLCAQIDAGVPVALGLVKAGPEDYLFTNIGDNHQVVAYGYDHNGSAIDIYVYDNNYPDREIILSTDLSDTGSYVNATMGGRWRGLFVETYNYLYPASLVSIQNDWRWCHKCNGIFWGAGELSIGRCPAGDQHERGGSGDYTLAHNASRAGGQNDWRWCFKCNGLFWSGGQATGGLCPAGGQHIRGGSGDYTVMYTAVGVEGQTDWRWCEKCSGLVWAGGQESVGRCPSGGQHTKANSSDYTLTHSPSH